MKGLLLTLLTVLAVCPFPQVSAAERVALVVGNNSYVHGSPLKNCVNDARTVAEGLRGCGFEVTLVEDGGLQDLEGKVREFKRAATGAKAAWFYYAGHGAEVAGTNYLIPVDAKVEEEFEVKHKTLPLDQVLGAMDGSGAPLKVVVLDCCRDNPFGRGWSRSGSQGLAQVGSTPKGTIIAYATAPGQVASDGNGKNSPYTSALVLALAKPGLEIDAVFRETGRAVQEFTDNKQSPWLNISFYGSFVVRLGGPGMPVAPAPPMAEVSPLDRGEAGKSMEMKLPGGVPVTFQYCPPGEFTMGSPKTEEGRLDSENQVPVRISKGFWMARTECTQAQWRAVMGSDPSKFKGDDLPVENVSWGDVQEFMGKLNDAGGLREGWKWSLPTEAQWEYACRAGTTTVFSFGNSLTSRQANFGWKYGDSVGETNTSRVGSYAANEWGLYDMHGSVWECCTDWYAKGLQGGADPKGPLSGLSRVVRGGSWSYDAISCRAAFRFRYVPGLRTFDLGFRPALVLSR